MKRIFNTLGLLCLILISFVYTEKSMMVVREYDSIMIKIKEQKNITSINAIIQNDTIIPGIMEKKINVKESYKRMKEYGFYSTKLLVYDTIMTKQSLNNHLDKYIIGGNKSKNMVSLILKLNWNSNINELKKIIDKYNIKVNFIVNNNWINEDIIQLLVNENHLLIGNAIETNKVIKTVYNQDKQYCYLEKREPSKIQLCMKNNNYTILPIYIKDNLLLNTKKNINSGAIISYEVTNNLINDLDNIIKYIHSKGLTITNLIEHLEE